MNRGESSAPAVELRGISKRFGPRIILDAIDLEVSRGEVLVLVGQSGSGKSTLLKVVSGIETPDAGRVLLGGADCTDLPPFRRAVHTARSSQYRRRSSATGAASATARSCGRSIP